MNIFILLQAVMVLIVLNVMISRYARRRHEIHRNQLNSDETKLRQLDQKIVEAQRREQVQQTRGRELGDAVAAAKEQLAAAERELDALRKAPPDLYFVFDRLEPRPGIIWEVSVSRTPDVPLSPRMSAIWKQPRRYLIAAKTPKEAQDRASARFFEKTGLMVERVEPCALFLPKRPDADVELGSYTASNPAASPNGQGGAAAGAASPRMERVPSAATS